MGIHDSLAVRGERAAGCWPTNSSAGVSLCVLLPDTGQAKSFFSAKTHILHSMSSSATRSPASYPRQVRRSRNIIAEKGNNEPKWLL